MYLWDKSGGTKVELRNPKSVLYEDYLYARWDLDGTRDRSAEQALNHEIDNTAPRFVRELVQKFPDLLPLSEEDRLFLTRLIVRSILRNPATLRWGARLWGSRLALWLFWLSRKLRTGKGDDVAVDRYGKRRVLEGEFFYRVATHEIDAQVQAIARKQFVFVVPENGAPNFILGSQPYFLNANGGPSDLCISLTLHPRLMVGLTENPGADKVLIASVEDVNRINGLTIKYSNALVMVNAEDAQGAWFKDHGREHVEEEFILVSVKQGRDPEQD